MYLCVGAVVVKRRLLSYYIHLLKSIKTATFATLRCNKLNEI